jgi:hypothetical protein
MQKRVKNSLQCPGNGILKKGGYVFSFVSRFAIHYWRAFKVADGLNIVWQSHVPISRALNFRWPIQGEHGLPWICGSFVGALIY